MEERGGVEEGGDVEEHQEEEGEERRRTGSSQQQQQEGEEGQGQQGGRGRCSAPCCRAEGDPACPPGPAGVTRGPSFTTWSPGGSTRRSTFWPTTTLPTRSG